VAKALAVRVRFPAWSASVRSRHLSIVICRSSDIRCARLRTASTKFVRKRGLRGQSRSSTAIEHPKKVGRRGFDSHRARQFRRAAEFGLSAKRETASAFKPRTIGQPMNSHLSFSPSFFFLGWAAVLWLSNCVAQMRESVSYKREDAGSIPVQKHRGRLLSILQHFRRVAGLGYRLLSAWSPVRVRPPAPDAGVAQW
jgi:hypothetical protein